jgi:hypothetical protein
VRAVRKASSGARLPLRRFEPSSTIGGAPSPGSAFLSWGWPGLQRNGSPVGAGGRIGLPAPSLVLARGLTFEVFAPPGARIDVEVRFERPSRDLRLPFRVWSYRRRCLQTNLRAAASLAVLLPFDVFPVPGSHHSRRRPTSEYVPSQRFSRSQGLAPPDACRPCFMPVPPLGFLPSRVDIHPQSRAPSRKPLPSWG